MRYHAKSFKNTCPKTWETSWLLLLLDFWKLPKKSLTKKCHKKEACNYMHCWRGLASSDASFRETHQKMTIFWLATFGLWFCGFWNFQTGDTSKQKWTKTKESEKKLRLRYFILSRVSSREFPGREFPGNLGFLAFPFPGKLIRDPGKEIHSEILAFLLHNAQGKPWFCNWLLIQDIRVWCLFQNT